MILKKWYESNKFKDLFDFIVEQDSLEKRPLATKIIKLQEELGELAESFLLEDGYKFNKDNLTQEAIRVNTEEEVADIFIMIICVANELNMDKQKLTNIVHRKLDKWSEKIKAKQLNDLNKTSCV
jgi:NTP pyrophosphatase (non-canonical NTP hydrolase)